MSLQSRAACGGTLACLRVCRPQLFLVAVFLIASCGLQRQNAFREAFQEPQQKSVVVAIPSGIDMKFYGPSSSAEGFGEGLAMAPLMILNPLTWITFGATIPAGVYMATKRGGETAEALNTQPDWQAIFNNWARVNESRTYRALRENLQNGLGALIQENTDFSSVEAAKSHFSKTNINATVVAITKITLVLQVVSEECKQCVTFGLTTKFELIDARGTSIFSGEEYQSSYESPKLAESARMPLPEWLANDGVKLTSLVDVLVQRSATKMARSFQHPGGR